MPTQRCSQPSFGKEQFSRVDDRIPGQEETQILGRPIQVDGPTTEKAHLLLCQSACKFISDHETMIISFMPARQKGIRGKNNRIEEAAKERQTNKN